MFVANEYKRIQNKNIQYLTPSCSRDYHGIINDTYYLWNPSSLIHEGKKYTIYRAARWKICKHTHQRISLELGDENLTKKQKGMISHLYWTIDDKQDFKTMDLKYFDTIFTNRGFEDPRLFIWDNSVWCIANYRYTHKGKEISGPIVFELNNKNEMYKLTYGKRKSVEKNWLPIIINQELHVIYSLNPYKILRLTRIQDISDDQFKGLWVFEDFYEQKINMFAKVFVNEQGFGGSTVPIKINDTYLGLFHSRYDSLISQRYIHRKNFFVLFDNEFKIIKIGKEFKAKQDTNIEFAGGMYYDGNVHISFGIEDSCCFFGTYTLSEIYKTFL